jgi:phage-related protein
VKRTILFYGDYFPEFYSKQDDKTKEKIDYVIDLVRNIERVPIKFLKYLEGTDGLYEVRIAAVTKNIRIFGFFDEEKLIILLNCFVKKTDKTPKKEIERGMKLKEEYFMEKKKRKK